MNTAAYFQHIRSIGPFRAEDAIALARQAEELDRIAEARKITPPALVCNESMPDGSGLLRLSFAIKTF